MKILNFYLSSIGLLKIYVLTYIVLAAESEIQYSYELQDCKVFVLLARNLLMVKGIFSDGYGSTILYWIGWSVGQKNKISS